MPTKPERNLRGRDEIYEARAPRQKRGKCNLQDDGRGAQARSWTVGLEGKSEGSRRESSDGMNCQTSLSSWKGDANSWREY